MTDMSTAKERARAAVDALAPELIRLSKEIHAHPELAWVARHAYGLVAPFLKAHGFALQDQA